MCPNFDDLWMNDGSKYLDNSSSKIFYNIPNLNLSDKICKFCNSKINFAQRWAAFGTSVSVCKALMTIFKKYQISLLHTALVENRETLWVKYNVLVRQLPCTANVQKSYAGYNIFLILRGWFKGHFQTSLWYKARLRQALYKNEGENQPNQA